MQTAVRVLLTLVIFTFACLLGLDMANYYLYSPWTRDARVRADVSIVAPGRVQTCACEAISL
jgi:multidrug resistance efflux pump